uniref:SPIN-DOC-like zinc-finger domain-containing protein n=1 Tax=Sphenodon punctatus TaxID=8508 RepID=A0A8D0G0A3_SPHPU
MMSSSKKRKVDQEGRLFKERWTVSYFFVNMNGKPMCLICNKFVAVMKEYNIRRHYNANHGAKYDEYTGKLREDICAELAESLRQHQSLFAYAPPVNLGALKASYVIAHQIAVSSKSFSEGEFLNSCMLKAAEIMCPDVCQAFASIPLSAQTVAERICDLAENLNSQLQDKAKSFAAFSIAVNESTDVTGVSQLALFIRGIDENMCVTEELVELVPMRERTASDLFSNLVGALDRLNVDWTKVVSLATDGTSSGVSKKAGVLTKLKARLQAINPNQRFSVFHCILHQTVGSETLKMNHVLDVVFETVNFIRARGLDHWQFNQLLEECDTHCGLPLRTESWLSQGAALKRFFELRSEIQLFMDQQGKGVTELHLYEWLQDLAFMV